MFWKKCHGSVPQKGAAARGNRIRKVVKTSFESEVPPAPKK
jgi:hypothetical protein